MKTIMLVDDVEISNFILKKLISNLSTPCKIFAFTDPCLAVQALGELNPDIIFLDLNMPVMDGWQFLDVMNANKSNCSVYILSSSTSELDKRRSMDYPNVVSFLVKPVTVGEISKILMSVLV